MGFMVYTSLSARSAVGGVDYGPAVVHRLARHILHVHVKDPVRANAAGPGVMGPPYLYRPQPPNDCCP